MRTLNTTSLIIVLAFLQCKPCVGQDGTNRVEDSLRRVLKTDLYDTSRVNTMTQLARLLADQGRYEEVSALLKEAARYAEKSGSSSAKRRVLQTEGTLQFYKGDFLAAEKIWLNGKELADKEKDSTSADAFRGLLANVYLMQNNYLRALDIYLKLLKKAEATNNKNNQILYNGNIGTLYVNMKESAKALPYLERTRELIGNSTENGFLGIIMINLFVTYKNLKDYKHAELALKEAKRLGEQTKSTSLLQTASVGTVELYIAQEKFEEALPVAEQNIATFSKDISKTDLSGAYTQKANIYYALISANNQNFLDRYFRGSKSEALKAARSIVDSALHFQVESGQVANMNGLYETRSNIRRLQGDFEGALEDFMQYKTLNDSVYNIERNNEMTQKTMMYEFEKKEAATREEQLRKDIRARNIRNSIAAGFAISIFFGGIVYRQRNKISQAKKRSEELLLNILPADVIEELKVKGHAEAKMMDEVTVLFTDFKGFTAIAQHLTPKQLVADINECFSAFDLITERHGIEKIKTIGDSYMAAGGLPVPNTTHATDVVNAAIEIQQFMLAYKEKKEAEGKLFFEIRIGIHSGPVVAGIVGIKKFSFDIWGDSVNTASRMESSGEAGKINISESTYNLVKEHFRCKPRGKIQAKGIREIEMYFVEDRS